MAKASRVGLKNARELWRDPARRREIAFNYRRNDAGLSSSGANRPVQPLPYVTPALRWSFHSTVGRNGAVRWHAHQVNAGLATVLGTRCPGRSYAFGRSFGDACQVAPALMRGRCSQPLGSLR